MFKSTSINTQRFHIFFSAGIIQPLVQPKKCKTTDGRVSYKLSPPVSQNTALVLTAKSSDATTALLSGVEGSRPSKTSISAALALKQKNTTRWSSCGKVQLCNSLHVSKLKQLQKATGQMTEQKKGPISKIDHVQPPEHSESHMTRGWEDILMAVATILPVLILFPRYHS